MNDVEKTLTRPSTPPVHLEHPLYVKICFLLSIFILYNIIFSSVKFSYIVHCISMADVSEAEQSSYAKTDEFVYYFVYQLSFAVDANV